MEKCLRWRPATYAHTYTFKNKYKRTDKYRHRNKNTKIIKISGASILLHASRSDPLYKVTRGALLKWSPIQKIIHCFMEQTRPCFQQVFQFLDLNNWECFSGPHVYDHQALGVQTAPTDSHNQLQDLQWQDQYTKVSFQA